jgi:hypothetical protein
MIKNGIEVNNEGMPIDPKNAPTAAQIE